MKNQTSNQTPNKRENLTKKLHDIKQTVALPIIGNVKINVDDIQDVQLVNVNGKTKIKIIYTLENGEVRYTLLGAVFIDNVTECVRNGKTLEIIRDTETLRTEVLCE
jgi:hypothetical protein